jgi:hypothetical protein
MQAWSGSAAGPAPKPPLCPEDSSATLNAMDWPWGRLQRAGAVALLLGSLAVAVVRCSFSADVPFVWPSKSSPWRMAPVPVSAALQQWGRVDAPVTVFSRRFALDSAPADATLTLRALGRFDVRVNGVAPEGGRSHGTEWRTRRRLAIGPLLRSGANEIRVSVENRGGPGLLEARIDGLPEAASAIGWETWLDGRPLGPAVPADDTRVNPASLGVETPIEALVARASAIAALAALGAFAVGLSLRLSPARRAALPSYALIGVTLAWTWLFVRKFVAIPPVVGFDVMHHRAYVDHLIAQGALPLATDGWSMYHPPLFYAVAAAVSGLGENALAVLPWLALFAAALPMNLYTAAYFSNEAPHALLVGLALVAGVDALRARRTTARQALLVGLWLGLAALTKFTAIAVVPVALFFLACKLLAIDRAPRRALGLTTLAGGTAAAIAGWFYVRAWVLLGEPLVGNWNLPGEGMAWWQQPGFHTPAYYLGFGESLRHPYLSGFHSFADGLYSTLWGDGGIAGRMFPAERHPFWSYDFMSAGYLLALPVTVLLVYGAWRCVRIALTDPEPGQRAAFSFVTTSAFAVGYAILSLTLSLPYFAQAKAFYGLCLVAPLSLFFAAGAGRVDAALAGRPPLRLAFAGLLAAALGTFFLGFAA